jgi:hypothetical protein
MDVAYYNTVAAVALAQANIVATCNNWHSQDDHN